MRWEYISYAYRNALRYPKRLLTMMIGIALATFCILSLLSIVTTTSAVDKHTISEMETKNVNYKQVDIAPKTVDQVVTPELIKEFQSSSAVSKAYYYEDLSYNLWYFKFLIPWMSWKSKLNIEMSPIMLDVAAAKEYGLDQKIVAGKYFSGDPNEIIISQDLLSKFTEQEKVLQGQDVIISESLRKELIAGKGDRVKEEELIGQSVSFVYALDWVTERNILDTYSVPLKVIGVFDPKIGSQTQGDVWLPLGIKASLRKLDFTSQMSKLSGKMAVQATDVTATNQVITQADQLGFLAGKTLQMDGLMSKILTSSKVQNWIYKIALIIAVIISVVSLIVICYLVISSKVYEFILQRALGLTRSQLIGLFSIEMCMIAVLGSLLGLLLTLLLLNTNLNQLLSLNMSMYLSGSLTVLVLVSIPLIVLLLAFLLIHRASRTQLSLGLARGDS
ncbi:ABC transporter permease [Paenibacillus sp. KN14-4R]|uniref:ABC transporter permease n=1 Tax=Paenibacillus sp. KN14-4R TaxID=3445773 RepID=UPI003FA10035